MELTLKQKKLLKWIGYPLLALFTFVIALHVTFPYNRVKGKVIESLNDKYDVSIAEVEPTFLPGGIIFTKIVLQTRPDDPKEKPTTIIIDKLRVDAGLLAMIAGRVDLDILAEIGAGKIEGNIEVSSGGMATHLSTSSLPLETVPGLKSAIGLPMAGGLDAKVSINLPNNKWSKAHGEITLECPGCTIGDGKTKISPPKRKRRGRFRRRRRGFPIDPNAGLTVPKLALGDTSAVITIEDGIGTIETFSGKSKDGEMKIEGKLRFSDPFKKSKLPGCFHFKLSDALKKREPNFGNIMAFLDVSADKDGWGHMKMVGYLPQLSFRPVKNCVPGQSLRRKRRRRPRVRTRPPRRRTTAGTDSKVRNLRKNLDRGKKPATPPTSPADIGKRAKKFTPPKRGVSGPELRKKMRGRKGDDVKKPITLDEKGRPSDSARPENADEDRNDRQDSDDRDDGEDDNDRRDEGDSRNANDNDNTRRVD